MELKGCHCCGLVQQVPIVTDRQQAVCRRCQAVFAKAADCDLSAARTAALALSAFCLFWPAILLPILEVERLGHRHSSSILGGAVDLIGHGSWFVGFVVLLFSIVFPLTKLLLLLELSLFRLLHARLRGITYRLVEHVGKWSMMDVMLLALLVMLIKVGKLVEFHFGPAVVAFVACVTLSMLASWSFDPHSVWNDDE